MQRMLGGGFFGAVFEVTAKTPEYPERPRSNLVWHKYEAQLGKGESHKVTLTDAHFMEREGGGIIDVPIPQEIINDRVIDQRLLALQAASRKN